jgi:hypothetical protein
MKTFRVEAKLHIAAFVQAETEEAAISEVADLLEWPGGLLDEEYTAKECICSDVLDWMNKNNRFCPDCMEANYRKEVGDYIE